MTTRTAVLDALQSGPLSRPQIEIYVLAVGYAPASVTVALWQLKRVGRVQHLQRGGRYRMSLYALGKSYGD